MSCISRLGLLAGATVAACANALAQSPATTTLAPVTVTGNPLGAADAVAPVSTITGTRLLLRESATLGETLSGIPGVSSTYYGPNASRPIIRGLDGDRVRVLENSGTLRDVSNLSYDHAVALDPVVIERIEVLRGPGALLYGGSAVGGVVNVIDSRIPREPAEGISGRADVGFASANRERGGGLALDGGTQRIGLHVDVFDRRTSNVRVPVDLACTRGGITSFNVGVLNFLRR